MYDIPQEGEAGGGMICIVQQLETNVVHPQICIYICIFRQIDFEVKRHHVFYPIIKRFPENTFRPPTAGGGQADRLEKWRSLCLYRDLLLMGSVDYTRQGPCWVLHHVCGRCPFVLAGLFSTLVLCMIVQHHTRGPTSNVRHVHSTGSR